MCSKGSMHGFCEYALFTQQCKMARLLPLNSRIDTSIKIDVFCEMKKVLVWTAFNVLN